VGLICFSDKANSSTSLTGAPEATNKFWVTLVLSATDDSDQEDRISIINELVSLRFPFAVHLKSENCDLLSSRERRSLEKAIAEYKQDLSRLTLMQLEEFARKQEERFRDQELEREIEGTRLFNHPSAMADFDHWTRQALWSLDEANAILLGRDPDVVQPGPVRTTLPRSGFARQYSSLRQSLKRAEMARVLRFPAAPRAVFEWANTIEISLAEELTSLLQRRHREVDWWRGELNRNQEEIQSLKSKLAEASLQLEVLQQTLSNVQESQSHIKPLNPRERSTLDTIIITMAVKGYTFDPNATRSSVPAEIASDAQELGLSVTDETVREKLKAAACLLSTVE
jgi:hypothetical protein